MMALRHKVWFKLSKNIWSYCRSCSVHWSIDCYTSPCLLFTVFLSKLSKVLYIRNSPHGNLFPLSKYPIQFQRLTLKNELMWFTEGTSGYAVLRSELELTLPCCVLRCLCTSVSHVCFSRSDQPQVSREKTSGGGSMWSPGPLFTRKRLRSSKYKSSQTGTH